jgi:hypothetical protein
MCEMFDLKEKNQTLSIAKQLSHRVGEPVKLDESIVTGFEWSIQMYQGKGDYCL